MEKEDWDRFRALVKKKRTESLNPDELKELITLTALWNLDNMDTNDLREMYYEKRVEQMTSDPQDLDDELGFLDDEDLED